MPHKVLIVEDDRHMRDYLEEVVSLMQLKVESVSSGEEALEKIRTCDYDLILSDLRLPSIDGMEVLKTAKSYLPDSPVVLLTAFGTVQNAVQAMKLGAADYIVKPVSVEEVEHVIKSALKVRSLELENRQLRSQLEGNYRYDNIVGRSSLMQKVFQQIELYAQSRSTILITGETGTGKELVAKAIHYNSPRRELPFVSINCAAIPEGLIESELFGHEKGAFTGAIKTTLGRFELAHGGTLLLDEISEISSALQAKLLRVLQERQFERLGSGSSIQVDVRVVATSNRDLKEAVLEKKFREDLYYRLNVLPLHLPPLRDRKEDVPHLVSFFLERYNRESGKKIQKLDEEVMQTFVNHSWPGNVRELENYIERGVVVAKNSVLTMADLPRDLAYSAAGDDLRESQTHNLAGAERVLILKTLKELDDNRTRAAQKLGISTRTLRNKLKEYGLR